MLGAGFSTSATQVTSSSGTVRVVFTPNSATSFTGTVVVGSVLNISLTGSGETIDVERYAIKRINCAVSGAVTTSIGVFEADFAYLGERSAGRLDHW